MKVKDLIEILKKAENKEHSDIQFMLGDKEIFLKDIGQFGFVTDVIIEFS